jgi:hypothetical protein
VQRSSIGAQAVVVLRRAAVQLVRTLADTQLPATRLKTKQPMLGAVPHVQASREQSVPAPSRL